VIELGNNGELYLYYTTHTATQQSFLCLARSVDGQTWTKPKLGLVEFAGSKDNNIVIDMGGLTVNGGNVGGLATSYSLPLID
jgi:hypothetical protein